MSILVVVNLLSRQKKALRLCRIGNGLEEMEAAKAKVLYIIFCLECEADQNMQPPLQSKKPFDYFDPSNQRAIAC